MQAIRTRWHGSTNWKGTRISARAKAGSVVVSYDYALSGEENHRKAAEMLIKQLGWQGVYKGGEYQDGDYYWVFDSEYTPKTETENVRENAA